MDVMNQGLHWMTGRVVAILLAALAVALLAGGAGGYLIKGATTLARPVTAASVQAPSARHVPADYFGQRRTSAGYVAGL
jgi:hypothetical protein